jgi:hypothetical protein
VDGEGGTYAAIGGEAGQLEIQTSTQRSTEEGEGGETTQGPDRGHSGKFTIVEGSADIL